MATITPATRVAELLEHFPELEPVLIAQAPAFRKLRNPVLRRTIARVATLEQAAAVAGMSARELVMTLRRAAGLDDDTVAMADGEPPAAPVCAGAHAPASALLVDTSDGARVIDADALLEAGQVPLQPIFEAAGRLDPGDELLVLISFRPAPLTARLDEHGWPWTLDPTTDGRFALRIRPKPD